MNLEGKNRTALVAPPIRAGYENILALYFKDFQQLFLFVLSQWPAFPIKNSEIPDSDSVNMTPQPY